MRRREDLAGVSQHPVAVNNESSSCANRAGEADVDRLSVQHGRV